MQCYAICIPLFLRSMRTQTQEIGLQLLFGVSLSLSLPIYIYLSLCVPLLLFKLLCLESTAGVELKTYWQHNLHSLPLLLSLLTTSFLSHTLSLHLKLYSKHGFYS